MKRSMFKFAARLTFLLCLVLVVAACSSKPRGPRLANLASEVPVEQAFMSPPPGGPEPIAVIEQRFSNGVLQEILLDNPTSTAGENVLVVRAFGPMGEDRGIERMPLDDPTTADIRREMRDRFPGIRMSISDSYVQNRYGPFGFATGRMSQSVNCIYAWQEIRAKKSVLFPGYRGAVTWRLRMCGHATPRELLYLAYGLNINVYFLADNWNIFGGDLPEPNPDIGKLGKPLGPDKVVEDLSMAPPAGYGEYRTTTRKRSTRTTTTTTTRRQAADLANEPAQGAAVVPTPSTAERQRPPVSRANPVPAADPAQAQPQVQQAPSISAPTSSSQQIPRPQAPSPSSGNGSSGTSPSTPPRPASRAPSIPAPTTSGAIPTPQSGPSGGSTSGASGGSGGSSTSDGVRQVGPSTTLLPAPQAPPVIR
ncbi:cellulose biosynthesis protein BcsN [Amorphus orientalis]|uniref:Uncharacterized protein n=1 Tax=Amorphus orientalis TaxID=649198 RepID=A0AAE3VS76_9HYPH|nr:cellulose biosynthesis protein BcsN [Amorphus orientalis]MDQ0317213.1 hypothetical protein [Amorphus orientalis]